MNNDNGGTFDEGVHGGNDGEGIQDSVPGPPPPEPALGSAIGSQFDPPPPPPPPPGGPTPPVVSPPPTTESTWGTVTPSTPAASALSAPDAPTTWSSTTPTAPAASDSAAYATPGQAAEYPMAGAVAGDSGKGSSKLPWIFAVFAAVLLLGGGGFLAVSAFGASGGADTPEDAVDTMLAAMGEEDFVAIAELLEPSERRTIAEPALTELLPELKRLGVIDDSADAADVEGVDLVFTDVEYRVEELVGVDDMRHVYLTGGEVATTINGADLPFGSDVDMSDLDGSTTETIEETETPIVFVERDGRWYFSMWFTLAEAARLEAGERLPTADEAPARLAGDSPEVAVEGLFIAMVDFDLESMIGHMDPDEMAVLYRYAPLFLDEAQSELADVRNELLAEGFDWDMTDFDFDVDQSGDDAVVTMRGFTFEISGPDFSVDVVYGRDLLTGDLMIEDVRGSMSATTTLFSIEGFADGEGFDAEIGVDPEALRVFGSANADGESFEGELVLDESGVCSRYEVTGTDGTNESGCLEDDADVEGIGPIIEAMEEWPTEFPGVSFRTRQTDGGWYVSPISTMFDGVIKSLEGIEEGDFDEVFNPVADVAGGAIADPLDLFDDAASSVTDDDVLGGFSDPIGEEINVVTVADGTVEEFSGEVGSNGFDTFIIDFEAGSAVVLSAQSFGSGLDTTMTILDPNGSQIDYNDDAEINVNLSSGLDSQLVLFADQGGEYSIEIAGFGTSSGSYVLTVDRASNGVIDGEGTTTDPDDDFGELFLEDITTVTVAPEETAQFVGSLDDPAAIDSFELELGAGETITVTVESDPTSADPLDPVVTVLDPEVVELGMNDDAPANAGLASTRDSQVTVVTQTAGFHFIDIEAWAGGSSGAYTVTIERGAAGAAAPETTPSAASDIVVPAGSTEVFQGTVSDPQLYNIDLAAGDSLVITVESDDPVGGLDPVVTLLLNGAEIDFNDDAADPNAVADSFDSQLIVDAASSGTHQIEVRGFAGSTGAFTMTIERG